MTNLIRSFPRLERHIVSEVDSKSIEKDIDFEKELETIENLESWNPPTLHATDVYKTPLSNTFQKNMLLKEVELKIKIFDPSVQIISLSLFTNEEIKKFRQYAKDKKYSYLHFGGIRIGLAPLFKHGLNTPCIAEVFDTPHHNYDHARIGTIFGNLSTGCQYGIIFLDYSISLTDPHLKDCWKLMVGVQGLQMVDNSEFLSTMIEMSF